jgi:hypothetical protein
VKLIEIMPCIYHMKRQYLQNPSGVQILNDSSPNGISSHLHLALLPKKDDSLSVVRPLVKLLMFCLMKVTVSASDVPKVPSSYAPINLSANDISTGMQVHEVRSGVQGFPGGRLAQRHVVWYTPKDTINHNVINHRTRPT